VRVSAIGSIGALLGILLGSPALAQDREPTGELTSISGRTIDVSSGDPVAFADVQLDFCLEGSVGLCLTGAFARSDELGRFRFLSDLWSQPLPGGTYRVTSAGAAASLDFQVAVSVRFLVDEGENLDLGELFLTPLSCPAPR